MSLLDVVITTYDSVEFLNAPGGILNSRHFYETKPTRAIRLQSFVSTAYTV
jgi:hypothetical protein